MLVPLLTAPILVLAALCMPLSRALAATIAALGLLPPFWPESYPFLRLVLGIGAVAGLARVLDGEPTLPAWQRIGRALTIVDWDTVHRTERRFDGRALVSFLAYVAIAAPMVWLALSTRPGALWPGWLLGAIAMWAFPEAVNAFLAFATRAAGLSMPPLHDQPLRSRKLAEMWGKRWNLTVTRWLNEHVFRPLLRRGHPRLGVLASFAVSAVFHAYLAGAAGGALCALAMGSFFLVQGMLVIVERVLRLRGHVWFLAAMLLPAPLFLEPMFAIVKPSSSPLGPSRRPPEWMNHGDTETQRD